MTKLLEKAFKNVSKLPETEQNVLANWLLEELKAERKWDQAFAESEDVLGRLADDALKAHRHGKTTPLDTDKL
ncbi:hypothetical protein KJ633_04085 [bacterium]|nr:hypothetical protein [bacterium]MBU3955618.1 hypothetical protein [bacterium]MBU4134212.1 hypothetical protein [bacterium]